MLTTQPMHQESLFFMKVGSRYIYMAYDERIIYRVSLKADEWKGKLRMNFCHLGR